MKKVKIIKRIAVYKEVGYYDEDDGWIELEQEFIGDTLLGEKNE